MPWDVRKSKSGKGYDIVKKLSSGRTRVVGHSATRKSAEASVRARYASKK